MTDCVDVITIYWGGCDPQCEGWRRVDSLMIYGHGLISSLRACARSGDPADYCDGAEPGEEPACRAPAGE